jgi:CSLREA domain-containing protein
VNTTADTGDATPDGACNDGANHCSLREAIQEANAAAGEDRISFAIPGGGVHTLVPASALPAITERADLDATTQTGFAGTPLVEINGQSAGGADGLVVQAGPTRILGFAINRFSGDGIEIASGSSNVIQRNFLGTDPTGTIDRGNGGNGMRVTSAINTIGGPGAGNVISGNGDSGVLLAGAIETVQGNFIGTDLTGTQALGNGENGVRVDGHLERIGDIGGLGNVISANALDGVLINSNINTVQGNRIGTSAAGTADLGNGLDGVHLTGTGIANVILDNVIGGNTLAGVDIAQTPETGTPNTVQGNLIGVGSNGSTAIPSQVGVKVSNTANVLVGGVQPSKSNVVSGNSLTGIQVISSHDVTIQGNLVGLDPTGTTAVANSLIGVDLNGAVLVTVGGTGPGEGNVISGNGQEGLRALNNSQDDTILGNLIGTDVTGFVDRGNAFHGVDVSDAQDIDVGPGNVISGNNVNGVEIHGSSATGARVTGNRIGEGLGGGALANSSDGVQIFGGASGAVVGGAAAGEGNTIAGNGDDGVQLSSDGNQVLGNAIGVSAHRSGTPFVGVGNTGNGVEIQANGNTIGSLAPGQGNTIEVNGGAGVFVVAGTGNIVRGNSIADNVGLGIDLSPAGVTENDGDDSDTGANLKQNFPSLSGAVSSGLGSSIQGSFQGAPNAALDVDFYASPTCDSSGNGEGQRRIGTIGVLANGSGFASFVASLDPIDPGAIVTATATDQNGNTSEFSDCIRSVSAGGAAVSGDFDGDGFDDLAIGVPGETPSPSFATGAGAVVVVPGSPSGLDSAASVILTQGSNGVKDTPEAGDGFGSALAAGDFNGDGRDDLAVGVPGEDVGSVFDAGAVNVIYGTPSGLGGGGKNQLFTQDTAGVVNAAEAGDRFGSSLAAANLGKTSHADLAIGVPGEGVGTAAGAGGVNVLYGSAAGLATTGNQFWSQNSPGIAETAEAGDAFGFALAAKNLGHSSQADLAVGVPGEDLGVNPDAGAVHVIYGTATGLAKAGSQLWTQDAPSVLDQVDPEDGFGTALAAADFGNGGPADLAIGVPGENLSVQDQGAVNVLYGSTANGLAATGNQLWSRDDPNVPGSGGPGDRFGSTLLGVDLGNGAQADLVVGIPGSGLVVLSGVGAADVIFGSSNGLTGPGSTEFHQGVNGLLDAAELGDGFGGSLAGGEFGNGSTRDLAIGAPGEDGAAGAVNVVFGTPTGPNGTGSVILREGVGGIGDTAEAGDRFGQSMG